jgi:two-component system osmolarity sensor histidine kinase EnvZ
MRRMIDEYLDFARGDAGETPQMTDITALVAALVADYARAGETVTFEPAPPVMVMLRPDAIRRACTNLIDNALRYGGGVALIAIEQSLTFVRIKVADRGPGIPLNQQEHAFKPFTRLEPSRNAKTGGVGLGLSIARSVAQSHGGEVTLENLRDADGRVMGLEATLRLPQEVQALT